MPAALKKDAKITVLVSNDRRETPGSIVLTREENAPGRPLADCETNGRESATSLFEFWRLEKHYAQALITLVV